MMEKECDMKAPDQFLNVSRQDRLIHERVHDPYKTRRKLPEPTVCPSCHAVYHNGRWQWGEEPPAAHQEICQACHRTVDGYPAGMITLCGDYLQQHKTEILNLVKNEERAENVEHPLHRIMKIDERADAVVISTTDIHLPRRIGDALCHACKGDLEIHYDEEGYFLRIVWNREH